MTAALSKSARRITIERIKLLWQRRDVAPIPDHELNGFEDEALTDLARFWSFKDKHWVEESEDDRDAPDYHSPRDATPGPYAEPVFANDQHKRLYNQIVGPYLDRVFARNRPKSNGPIFYGAAGGTLTSRQAEARGKIAQESFNS